MTTDTLREAVARAIKPLRWLGDTAVSSVGFYRIETFKSGFVWSVDGIRGNHLRPSKSSDDARLLAQADFAAKMLAAFDLDAAITAIEAAGWRVVKDEPVFQDRVAAAHVPLFHDDPTDLPERRDRFYEEATEAVQALGMTEDEAHQLVAYTFGRPPGDVRKEIGAAALTLASLCVVGGWDMMECAEADLAALCTPEKIAKVRAKRASRHGRGPLPGIDPAAPRLDATVRSGEEG